MGESYTPILLVEDNVDDYEATERAFKKNHLMNPLIWCRDGQEAFDYLTKSGKYKGVENNEAPCLILLDLNMPGLDGRKLLEIIKGRTDLSRTPIVVLTTSKDEKDIRKCYDLGASTYIQKPVSVEGLTKAIGTMKDYWFGIAILPKP